MANESPTGLPATINMGTAARMDLYVLDQRVIWNTGGATAWRFQTSVPGGAWPTGTVPIITFEFSDCETGPFVALPSGAITKNAEGTTDAIWLLGLFKYASARVSTIAAAQAFARVVGTGVFLQNPHTNLGIAP